MNGYTIEARVRGVVTFPEHPDHEGEWGLQGAEDVTAVRTFGSIGAAMTWARRVLDGDVKPRNVEPAGPLLAPATAPQYGSAEVWCTYDRTWERDDRTIWYADGGDRSWREQGGDGYSLGKVVRTDPDRPQQ